MVDDSLYWGEFEIDPTDVSTIKAQYTGSYDAGMLHVDEIFVATTNGIYLRETYEQIVSGNFATYSSAIAITASGNILITEFEKLYIFLQPQ